MLTYFLFKIKSMLLSATSMKDQPDAWLTACQKPRACSCQQQARKCQPDANLQPVHTPRACTCQQQAGGPSWMLTYSLFKTRACSCQLQAAKDRCWHTCCLKPRACSYEKQPRKASQMLTYKLFKTQSMLLSATSRKGHQMLTYSLFKTQSMFSSAISREGLPEIYILFKTLLSATSREGLPDADLHPDQIPGHDFVSYKEGRSTRFWLTAFLKPRAWSCQPQAGKAN